MITLSLSVRALECLCAVSLIIQTLEFLRLRAVTQNEQVWSWQIQRQQLHDSPRWLQKSADWLYRDRVHHVHLLIRLAAAATLFFGSNLAISVALFLSTLLILIRWRGAFNGGSDFMTVVVQTGMVIAHGAALVVGPVMGWRAGLWYITIHAISSYFISGSVKLFDVHWRDGRALPFFIDGAIFGPLKPDSLFYKRWFAILSSWSFILWECSVPLALAGPTWAALWCLIAAVFHFLVFWHFGLNRFFWAWCASFPAIIYCSAQW